MRGRRRRARSDRPISAGIDPASPTRLLRSLGPGALAPAPPCVPSARSPLRSHFLAGLVGLAALVAAAPLAFAGAPGDLGRPLAEIPTRADVDDSFTRARVGVDLAFPADLAGDRGHLSRSRESLGLELSRRIDTRWTFRLEVGLELNSYRFDRTDAVVAGEGRLLEDAVRVRFRPGFDLRLDDDWQLGGDLALTASGAPDAEVGDATTIGGSFSVRRRFSAGFGLRLGVLAIANLDDAPAIVPIVIPDDGDEASARRLRFEVRGRTVRAGYAFSPCLTAGVTAGYERRDWRLSKTDRVPEGILRDLYVPVGLFLDWSPTPDLTIGLEAGVTVYEEIEVVDRDGGRVTIFDAEPAIRAGVSLAWRF